MILVTGANGSVGSVLVERLRDAGHEVCETDIETMDVTNEQQVRLILERKRPSVIFHLAGAKHAPEGEVDPWLVCNVNAVGTRNVLEHSRDAKVILASTCKACDPETAYGASKLIAERMVLNAGGVVVRYYNIPEASGNVFRFWESLPEDVPLPVTDCHRFFAPIDDCVALTIEAMYLPSGRYAPIPQFGGEMSGIAERFYPGRAVVQVPRRRGDRENEPLRASCESVEQAEGHLQITNPHDPAELVEATAAAA